MGDARFVIGVLLALAARGFAAEPPLHLARGPMLGHVSAAEARLWVQASGRAELAIRIGQAADLSDARVVAGPTLADETGFMGTVRIDGLKPLTRYHYAVL